MTPTQPRNTNPVKLIHFITSIVLGFTGVTATWAGRWDDSATAGIRTIKTPPTPPQASDVRKFFQSGFRPGKQGFSNAGDVNALCSSAYQNLTGVPITVTIVPGGSKDRYAHLFVKQSPEAAWVNMAYSQNTIPASVVVPDQGVYCPTMNEQGSFYVTVLQGGDRAANNYAVDYRFWTDEGVRVSLMSIEPKFGCRDVVAIRTYYANNQPAWRNYMIDGWHGEGLIPAYRAEPGGCEVPPPPVDNDNGGGQ